LVHRKGVDLLLHAVAAGVPKHAVFWIAGKGPERQELEAIAVKLGIGENVHFLGRRSDVADLLEACDLLVVPSRQEGLGVAALEAMACARPVLATSVGGLAEAVVHEQTGLLVASEDVDALHVGLIRLLEDSALRKTLGDAGAARVEEKFSADSMVSAYENLYLEVIGEVEG